MGIGDAVEIGLPPYPVRRHLTGDGRTKVCLMLYFSYQCIRLWIEHFWVEVIGPKKMEVKCTWIINPKAIEILNRALALGCKWAEEELTKIHEKRPKEPCLPKEEEIPGREEPERPSKPKPDL